MLRTASRLHADGGLYGGSRQRAGARSVAMEAHVAPARRPSVRHATWARVRHGMGESDCDSRARAGASECATCASECTWAGECECFSRRCDARAASAGAGARTLGGAGGWAFELCGADATSAPRLALISPKPRAARAADAREAVASAADARATVALAAAAVAAAARTAAEAREAAAIQLYQLQDSASGASAGGDP